MPGMSGSEKPPTDGTEYGVVSLSAVGEPELVFQLGTESKTVAIRAEEGNNSQIYLGWDDDVDSNNGFPLYQGEMITMELDVSSQEIYMDGDSVGDSVRVIAIN